MFGEYAQIAPFLSQSQRNGNGPGFSNKGDPLPAYLQPPPYHPPTQSWESGRHKNVLKEDFIMIAEFCELEGPKPVLTIPKNGGEHFDQNTFSVRILATDHQTQNEGFSISEDAQVVLSDYDTHVFAFVHHLVLYDNTARGFVRPYCIAYITADQRKLMDFYEDISSQMKKVARFFKFGNLLLFGGDLERHLKDLDHTKGVLLNQVSKMRLRDSEQKENSAQDTRKNAENELYRALQTIHQSTTEIKDILTVLRPLLFDKRLEERFRLLEERAFKDASHAAIDKLSLQENWFNDLSSLQSFDAKCGSLNESGGASPLSLFRPRDHKPLLVETKKANRFNAPLRGLHELCSWGAKEGLRKLRHVQEYFKRDMVILEIERTESKLFHPSSTGVFCGHCISGNFLYGMKRFSLDDVDSSSFLCQECESLTSFDSQDSYKSADDMSYLRTGNVSPCSFQTVGSQNNFLTSLPSSINNNISLGEENEYYPHSPKFHDTSKPCQDVLGTQDDKTPSSDSSPALLASTLMQNEMREGTAQTETDKPKMCNEMVEKTFKTEMDKSNMCHTLEMYDEENLPPLLIFNERIDRPLSVISLGCQEELEADSRSNEECLEIGSEADKGIERMKGNKQEVSPTKEIKNVSTDNFILSSSRNGDKISLQKQSPTTNHISSNSLLIDGDRSHSINISSAVSPSSILPSYVAKNRTKESSYQKNIEGDCFTDNVRYPKANNVSSSPSDCKAREIQAYAEKDLKSIATHSYVKSSAQLNIQDPLDSSEPSKVFEEDTSIFVSPAILCAKNKSFPSSPSNSPKIKTSFLSRKSQKQSPAKWIEPPGHLSHQTSENSEDFLGSVGANDLEGRSPSETSSSFTEISIQDYPGLFKRGNTLTLASFPSDLQSQTSRCEDDGNPLEADEHNEDSQASSGVWRPRHGLYTLGDWLNNQGTGRPGYKLLDIINSYSNLQHIIFSILIGRPVLVVGTAKMEHEVIKLVNALAVFVPSTKRKRHLVLEWTSKPLKVSDLTKLRLVGICRSERRSLDSYVPNAIKKASSILEVDRKLISAPPYHGQLIQSFLAKKKLFKTEPFLLTHIHWWMMDTMAKAFIFYHSFCMGSAGSILSSNGLCEHRDAYSKTVTGIMGTLGVRDSDCSIVEYMAELAKLSYIESSHQIGFDSGNTAQPFNLRYAACQTYRC